MYLSNWWWESMLLVSMMSCSCHSMSSFRFPCITRASVAPFLSRRGLANHTRPGTVRRASSSPSVVACAVDPVNINKTNIHSLSPFSFGTAGTLRMYIGLRGVTAHTLEHRYRIRANSGTGNFKTLAPPRARNGMRGARRVARYIRSGDLPASTAHDTRLRFLSRVGFL